MITTKTYIVYVVSNGSPSSTILEREKCHMVIMTSLIVHSCTYLTVSIHMRPNGIVKNMGVSFGLDMDAVQVKW